MVVSCGGEASTSVEESATDEPAVEETITEEPTTEESVIEAAVAEGPPNIPAGHATAGCPVCHEQGIGDAPKWPDNHAGYTEQICTSCHQSAG